MKKEKIRVWNVWRFGKIGEKEEGRREVKKMLSFVNSRSYALKIYAREKKEASAGDLVCVFAEGLGKGYEKEIK